ncbi:23S rRNA (uracil-C(5))-methyltransferase RlmCD [Urinicoccus massiliensis]|uniref:23S rRNA (Uracil-C(5))-methyltransferase RlmCD n=1 Tax=Urinicoccus massiliensis TaxID=1723382 RepID=A0A8H2M5B8_9FIRM|nr:23S rRNA (uracil(1939)-C(5))-methyltransferase RlmD [Urinicoccus massiliensis]VFB16684.1 23S rRNA (uracil-C(5))-methyltransferase RlmCD [Urinicoccus massiliensis]
MKEYLEGQVENMTHDGRGVVKEDRFPIFIPGALPGERILYQVTKKGKKFASGDLVEILQASPQRQEAKDPTLMPIMPLQILNAQGQKAFKENVVKQALERIAGQRNIKIKPLKTMDHPWFYRNKMTLAVKDIQGRLEFGIFGRKSHDFIPVDQTYLAEKPLEESIFKARDILRKHKIQAYDPLSKQGNLHHIILKRGHYSGETMILFVCKNETPLGDQALYQDLKAQIPQLVSIAQNKQEKDHQEILGRKTKILWGDKYLKDQLLGLSFYQSPQAFYQVNTPQTEVLYQLALDYAQLQGTERVLDAYCGLGTISLHLAKKARQVHAMEILEEAIQTAEENKKINQITNAHFQAGKAEKILPQWQKQGLEFDLALVDPPRKGLDPSFIQSLGQLAPGKIIYISCNPATLARDCKEFVDLGYQIQEVQPVDLFPQTPHVECIALIQRVKG